MTKPKKLSLSTVAIGHLGKHSANRVQWVTSKKQAVAKKIDPDAAFKKVKGELGTELDRLRDLVEAAKKFRKAYGPLDAADKQLVTDQVDKCTKLIRDYQKVCDTEQKKAGSSAKQDAWQNLHLALHNLEAHVDATARPAIN
jgi:hypothetical protein